jgi:hypothetical protein
MNGRSLAKYAITEIQGLSDTVLARQADDRPPDMALVCRAQLRGDVPVTPARREW